MDPTPAPGGKSDVPVLLALHLIIAQLAYTGTRADRLRLHAHLQPVAGQHPVLAVALRELLEDRPKAERWRAYARAEAAAADWVDDHAAASARLAAGAVAPRPRRRRSGR
jgi:hypothetical protein